MAIGERPIDIIFPPYLVDPHKGRVKKGLEQFFKNSEGARLISYDYFYHSSPPNFFLQGDILNSLPSIIWDYDEHKYKSGFSPGILISNSCDVEIANKRTIPKQALFAPIISLNNYIESLTEEGIEPTKIDSLIKDIKSQEYTNIFYLPNNIIDGNEFIAFLDQIWWVPVEEFEKKIDDLEKERFVSLDYFGHYLLLVKLSIHFCRLPEETDRSSE